MTPSPDPQSDRKRLSSDELIAVFVALTSIGAIFFWSISQKDGGLSVPFMQSPHRISAFTNTLAITLVAPSNGSATDRSVSQQNGFNPCPYVDRSTCKSGINLANSTLDRSGSGNSFTPGIPSACCSSKAIFRRSSGLLGECTDRGAECQGYFRWLS